jgi:hypothetical protein
LIFWGGNNLKLLVFNLDPCYWINLNFRGAFEPSGRTPSSSPRDIDGILKPLLCTG